MAQARMSDTPGSGVSRSNDGTFVCGCNKRYREVQSLNRHRKICIMWDLLETHENVGENSSQGNFPIP